MLSASCTELTSTWSRTPVGSFARTRVPGRNRSCTGRGWGLDSDECFVAFAIVRVALAGDSKQIVRRGRCGVIAFRAKRSPGAGAGRDR